MENFSGDRRCLICRQPSLTNLSRDSQTPGSNSSCLQDFLNLFHMNIPDSEVNDLSTSCKFCSTCEQLIAERSSIQTQMTQLTRRATQLKTTLSALLLSAPQIQKQNHDDVTDIMNNTIKYSREAELHLLLQKMVDDIRIELQREYSVNSMVDKMQLPRSPSKLNQEEFAHWSVRSDNADKLINGWRGCNEPDDVPFPNKNEFNRVEASEQIDLIDFNRADHDLSDEMSFPPLLKLDPLFIDYDDIDEAWNHGQCIQFPVVPKIEPLSGENDNDDELRDPLECGAHDSEQEYLPSGAELNDVESPEQFLEMRMKTEEDFSQDILDSEEMNVKAGTSKTYKGPTGKRKRITYTTIVPNGPNRFKYNGFDIRLNDEDQFYYCGVCQLNCGCQLNTVLRHIRDNHYTPEDKIKFTAVKTSNTEWLYGGKYKITKVDEKKFMCAPCGAVRSSLQSVVTHIRSQHVELDGAGKVVPLQVIDKASVIDSTRLPGELESLPFTFIPADKKFTSGLCEFQVPTWNNLGGRIRQSHSAPPTKVVRGICAAELVIEKADREHASLPLKCPTCQKQFLTKLSFKKHMEVHELGEEAKKHKCEFCGKRFLTLQHCKDHQRLHTGEKPYECQICGQKFSGSSYLTRHRKSAHGIQPEGRRVVKVSK